MRIERIRWAPYRLPFRVPYATSHGAVDTRAGVILEMLTDDGGVGIGEAVLMPDVLDQSSLLEAASTLLNRDLIGRDPDDARLLDSVGVGLPESSAAQAVCFALDTALCDIAGRAAGVSIARLLKPDAAEAVAVNALVARPGLEAVFVASNAVASGFGCIKLKVGTESSLASEVRRVAAVREAIGPDIRLRLDPNGAWSVREAIEAINALAQYDIEYVEQPIAEGDLASLARVQAAVGVPIAADEDMTGLDAARAIIAAGAAQVLILKPSRVGGLRATLGVIEEAARQGVRCLVTTSIESGVGTAACLQIAACLPAGSPASGLATASLLAADIATPTLLIARGVMQLPPQPGIGVELDREITRSKALEWREVTL